MWTSPVALESVAFGPACWGSVCLRLRHRDCGRPRPRGRAARRRRAGPSTRRAGSPTAILCGPCARRASSWRASRRPASPATAKAAWGRSRAPSTGPSWCRRWRGRSCSRRPVSTGPSSIPATTGCPTRAWERALTRGAYDEASLARSLREGLDPDGRLLVAPMPRYALDDQAVAALAAYLRGLSAEAAPGVEPIPCTWRRWSHPMRRPIRSMPSLAWCGPGAPRPRRRGAIGACRSGSCPAPRRGGRVSWRRATGSGRCLPCCPVSGGRNGPRCTASAKRTGSPASCRWSRRPRTASRASIPSIFRPGSPSRPEYWPPTWRLALRRRGRARFCSCLPTRPGGGRPRP